MKTLGRVVLLLALAGLAWWFWPPSRPDFTPDPATAGTATAWTAYGGDGHALKYSSLDQINKSNVHRLEVAWTYRTGDPGRHADRISLGAIHSTPIKLPAAAGGHLVLCTPFNRIVALDPARGTVRWEYDAVQGELPGAERYNCRGVAVWHDSQAAQGSACEWRIFMGTNDRRLVAVDARDGKACDGFGDRGRVDVTPLIAASTPKADPAGIAFYSPPAIVGDTVVLGATGNAKFHNVSAPTGAARGFDARTGALRWTFDPIPHDPADPMHSNWTPEGLEVTGGAEPWSMLAVDEARDMVFLPTSSPSPDFYGGRRPGDNRYANSIVALRGSTGQVLWHFQIVHHDVWDLDVPSQPILADLERDGRKVPVVIQLSKSGMVFVFHRETGEPFFPIEERPVPTDGVPGEQLSPTQPFPVKPAPLVKQTLSPDDAWGVAPNFRKECREKIEQAAHGTIYTPPSTRGLAMMPGSSGGMNWGGGAFDPASGLLVTPVMSLPFYVRLVPLATSAAEVKDSDRMAGFAFGPPGTVRGSEYAIEQRPLMSKMFTPCTAPPWSELVAVDMKTAEVKWRVPLGTIDKLSPVPVPLKWGTPTGGGPIVTAGGIAVMAGTADERMRAWDLVTGRELWKANLPTSAMSTPMTYEEGGRQFIVVSAGGHMWMYPKKIADYVVAYALP